MERFTEKTICAVVCICCSGGAGYAQGHDFKCSLSALARNSLADCNHAEIGGSTISAVVQIASFTDYLNSYIRTK